MEKIVDFDDDNTRLDRWLFKNGLVNSVVESQKFIRAGKVRVNDSKVKINARIFGGEVVLCPEVRVEKTFKREKYKATDKDKELLLKSVVYKDDNIMVINKPAGLAVQGGSGSYRNLDSMLDALKFDKDMVPKLVHRLDKHTSGVLILARNNTTARKLLELFKEKKIKKVYEAWVLGVPSKKEGNIDAPLLKKTGDNEKVIVSSSGKSAVTGYKVLKIYNNGEASLIEAYPKTGRMHQIRVHLSYIGHPIIGDGKYGGKKVYLKKFEDKMHLHARRVSFPSMEDESKIITVEANVPPHFER